MNFDSDIASHYHSLETLDVLETYSDFMKSVDTVADMGCGNGLDLEWWATRTDEDGRPLNIKCTGFDRPEDMGMTRRYKNISYVSQDFEDPIQIQTKKFDVIWCHNSFQYVVDPFTTLRNWWHAMNTDGMLLIAVPQTTNIEFNTQAFDQPDLVWHNWTLTSLIHILALSGFDCSTGYFKKSMTDPWLHTAVYRSNHEPMNPKTTRWYDLADRGLLPISAVASIDRHGYLRQRDLVLPWLDKSLATFSRH